MYICLYMYTAGGRGEGRAATRDVRADRAGHASPRVRRGRRLCPLRCLIYHGCFGPHQCWWGSIYPSIHLYTYVSICVCVYIHMYIYIYMYMFLYIYINIYIYI